MWFIVYNEKAFWAVIPAILGGLGVASFTQRAMPSLLAGGVIAFLVDFVGRLRNNDASPALIHPDAGGHVWFLPIWILGALFAASYALSWAGWV